MNYAIQYYCHALEDFNDYVENYAPALKQKTFNKYGEKVLAFRTLLEEV